MSSDLTPVAKRMSELLNLIFSNEGLTLYKLKDSKFKPDWYINEATDIPIKNL